ncbi:type II toxin-antitoxin system VapC family toxin [Ruania suaedae]|uniref:type II toxin-antitoxin system VapC family toxin n=1 Tax=Ruania suaedae TaxID=2897774 RepID=UPI001E3A0F48|nr:type II toxin-antitoxin system VapC family toxin [Ruania suaedae]UFU03212.1 type II toxin-antitoxin system VapC family toxin [Ruania suaedae]
MTPLFLDPAILLLAIGGEHPDRDPCRRIVESAAAGRLRLHMSVEGGQEFLFHRMRRGDRGQALAAFDTIRSMVIWHDFTSEVLLAARDLVAASPIRGRDAVHAATAANAGFTRIVSTDADFDALPALVRVHPADLESPAAGM